MKWTKTAFVILCALLTTQFMQAQDCIGSWKGTLEVQGMKLPLIFNVSSDNGTLSSTMDSPDQGAVGIPMDKTTFENNELTIAFTAGGIKYVGKVDGEKIDGTFFQAGQEFPLALAKTVKTKPGNTALPSSDAELAKLGTMDKGDYKYSVEDYFEKPKTSQFQFSPNGKYFSYREKDENGKQHVFVKNTATDEVRKAIEEGEELIRGYGWVNDNRLVYVKDLSLIHI